MSSPGWMAVTVLRPMAEGAHQLHPRSALCDRRPIHRHLETALRIIPPSSHGRGTYDIYCCGLPKSHHERRRHNVDGPTALPTLSAADFACCRVDCDTVRTPGPTTHRAIDKSGRDLDCCGCAERRSTRPPSLQGQLAGAISP